MRPIREVAGWLGFAGVVPFAGLVLIAWTGSPDWLQSLLVGYAVLILAFMAGGLWVTPVVRSEATPMVMYISAGLVLAALPILILPLAWACLVLAVLFIVHWFSEWRGLGTELPAWYLGQRKLLSALVIGLLIAAGLLAR